MRERDEFKTNPLDSVQTSLVCLIEGEAEELLQSGPNPQAKRILDACNKLFRWADASRIQLTDEQRAKLDEVFAVLA